jgi:hypothetical protein
VKLVVGVVAVCLVALVATYYVKGLDGLDSRADANAALGYSDRRIARGNSVVLDQEAALEAESLIPRHAKYRVRVSSAVHVDDPLAATFAESWFRYFLMPRRPAPSGKWIICYRCDTSEVGDHVVRWRDREGISILERR